MNNDRSSSVVDSQGVVLRVDVCGSGEDTHMIIEQRGIDERTDVPDVIHHNNGGE